MIRFVLTAIIAVAVSQGAAAQESTATTDSLRASIDATVHDSLGNPVTGASVFITPGGWIYRTDSAGRFKARNIPAGALTVGVRKVGFSPLQSRVVLNPAVDLTLDLVMDRLPQMLAEIEVRAERQCTLVVMWSMAEAQRQLKRLAPKKERTPHFAVSQAPHVA